MARHIRLAGHPNSVITHPRRSVVYALTPENGTVHEIRSDTLALSGKVHVAASAVSMRLSHDAAHLYVLCKEPRKLVRLAVEGLPEAPSRAGRGPRTQNSLPSGSVRTAQGFVP